MTRLLSLFLQANDPDREKRRLLKRVAQRLRKQRPKLYNPRKKTAEPALGRVLHEFYRALGPAQVILQSAESSKLLKQTVVEASFTEEQLELRDGFSEQVIRERAESTDPKELADELKEEWREFCRDFDSVTIKEMHREHELVQALVALIGYDYYYLLRKFDSKYPEGDFLYNPHFDSLEAGYIAEELKHFCELLCRVESEGSWEKALDMLRQYRQSEVVSWSVWQKLLRSVGTLQRRKVLELLVRLIEEDPFYQPETKGREERIVDEYLSELKIKIDSVLRSTVNDRRTEKRESMARKVFGDVAMSKLTNYTEEANRRFIRRTLPGYTHTVPLGYLKAFLLDYYKKDVKEVVGLLLIKGKWIGNSVSGPLSDAHQQLLMISKRILEFDDSLEEDEQLGMIVKNANLKAIRNKNNITALAQLLNGINETAKDLVFRAARDLITVGKVLRSLLEDRKRQPAELMLNWSEIDGILEPNLSGRLVGVYNKLYQFIQLIRMIT